MAILTRLPLRRRIMVLVTVGLGVTLAIAAAAGLQVIAQSTQRVLDERLITARLSAANLDERLAVSMERLAEVAMSRVWDVRERLPDPAARTLAAAALRPGLFSGGFAVVDRSARVVWPDAIAGTVLTDPTLHDVFGGGRRISGLIRLPSSQAPVAIMWVPLRNAAGSVTGGLGGIIDLQRGTLTELIRPLAPGRTGHAVIVDAGGVVLAGTDASEQFTRGDHPDFFGTLIRLHRADVARTPEIIDGVVREQHVMAFAPLAIGNWGLSFGQAEWEVFLLERRLRTSLFLLALLLVSVGLLVAWWDAGVIATPLRRLTDAAQRIADDDLGTFIPPEAGHEIGLLAATLEAMRSSLARARAELESRTNALQRQAEQTRALYDVSRAILSDAHLSDVLATITSSARSLLGADVSSVCLWDAQRRQVIPGAFDGPPQAFLSDGGPAFCEQGALGEDGRPSDACPFIQPEFRRVHVTGDVRAGDRLIGFMCVGGVRARSFRDDDARLLAALAGLAALAIESAQLRERVQHLALLEERERIGRDLHDSAIQSLYGISLGLEHVQHLIASRPGQAASRLDTAIDTVTEVIQGIRSYVLGLHPQSGGESLADALERVVREFRVNSLLPVEFHAAAPLPDVPTEERLHLQLLVREALANALRHAGATSVAVRATIEHGVLHIVVQDDGCGFDPDAASGGPGLGLRTMTERARRLGGTLTVRSAQGVGTTVDARVPAGWKGETRGRTH